MGKVLGVGGVFFKCENRESLAAWYAEHLGLPISDFGGAAFEPNRLPKGAVCVWGPFDASTTYFAPSDKGFMINLIVDDVEAVLAQAAAAGGGGERVGDIEEHEQGRFGWFMDPEGNKVELWEPAG